MSGSGLRYWSRTIHDNRYKHESKSWITNILITVFSGKQLNGGEVVLKINRPPQGLPRHTAGEVKRQTRADLCYKTKAENFSSYCDGLITHHHADPTDLPSLCIKLDNKCQAPLYHIAPSTEIHYQAMGIMAFHLSRGSAQLSISHAVINSRPAWSERQREVPQQTVCCPQGESPDSIHLSSTAHSTHFHSHFKCLIWIHQLRRPPTFSINSALHHTFPWLNILIAV